MALPPLERVSSIYVAERGIGGPVVQSAMSWHTKRKGGTRYYYRSFRENGRSRKQYVGIGSAAEAAACDDQQRRQAREAQREALSTELAQVAVADSLLMELKTSVDLLLHASLVAAGYHLHKRTSWRRRRHGSNTSRTRTHRHRADGDGDRA